MISIGTKIN